MRQHRFEELGRADESAHGVVHWLSWAGSTGRWSLSSAERTAPNVEEALLEYALNDFCVRRCGTCEQSVKFVTKTNANMRILLLAREIV